MRSRKEKKIRINRSLKISCRNGVTVPSTNFSFVSFSHTRAHQNSGGVTSMTYYMKEQAKYWTVVDAII